MMILNSFFDFVSYLIPFLSRRPVIDLEKEDQRRTTR